MTVAHRKTKVLVTNLCTFLGECKAFVGLVDVLYTVLSTLPVISHVAQLFLEPYAVSQVPTFFKAIPLSPAYSVNPFQDVDLLYRMYTSTIKQ